MTHRSLESADSGVRVLTNPAATDSALKEHEQRDFAEVRPKVNLWWREMTKPIPGQERMPKQSYLQDQSAHILPGFLGLLSVT